VAYPCACIYVRYLARLYYFETLGAVLGLSFHVKMPPRLLRVFVYFLLLLGMSSVISKVRQTAYNCNFTFCKAILTFPHIPRKPIAHMSDISPPGNSQSYYERPILPALGSLGSHRQRDTAHTGGNPAPTHWWPGFGR